MKLNSNVMYMIVVALVAMSSSVVSSARLGGPSGSVTADEEFKRRVLQDDNDDVEFCWRDTVTRGVGLIPDDCPDGKVKIGLLCYSQCPAGYTRFGVDCHQTCPAGFISQGLFCRKAEYGRGAGYPWHFGDPLNDSSMFARCENNHGQGNCETWGAVVYPKCDDGYSPYGCCLCRPAVPACRALGMNDGIDLSCAKKIIIGDPTPMACSPGLHESGGLCYQSPCPSGTDAVGPICWDTTPPPGFVFCGMGYAKNGLVCADKILNQIVSVFDSAVSIATLGIYAAAKAPATTSDKLRELAARIREAEKEVEGFTEAIERAQLTFDTHQLILGGLPAEDVLPADAVRMGSDIIGLLDPTGV